MNFKTTFLLLALLGLLAGAVWWQLKVEALEGDVDMRLFEGVDVSQVMTIRIDDIEDSSNLRLERDGQGLWYLTDPLNYPANPALVGLLLEDIASARGLLTPKEEWGEKELGFDPPRMVLEVDERRPDGIRTVRLEIGAPDLDRIRLNVRIDGQYLRCLVRLYTTLNHPLDGYRSRRAMTIRDASVIEVQRKGRIVFEVDGEAQDLELHALLDRTQWRSTLPKNALLGAMDVAGLIRGATGLEIKAFVEESAVDLKTYALDRPLARFDFKTDSGATETLLVSRPNLDGQWYAKRLDSPTVWSINPESALWLMVPTEVLYDRHFMRAFRDDVMSLRLVASPQKEVRLQRTPEGWVVQRKLASGEFSEQVPADKRRVEDDLARLEDLELDLLQEGLVDESARGIDLDSAVYLDIGGEMIGGRLGRVMAGELATAGLLFRRDGDELLLSAPDWIEGMVRASMDEFRSKALLFVHENQITEFQLARGEKSLVFKHDKFGIWHLGDSEDEAVELLPLLDPLMFLKAEEFLGTDLPMNDALELTFTRYQGEPVRLRVGAGEDPDTSVAEVGGSFSRLKAGRLHSQLSELLRD
ncbi:MAG: hypothetical protein ACI8X5_002336 [Planctomycetota bacterium]|jgi:hypothetical protein